MKLHIFLDTYIDNPSLKFIVADVETGRTHFGGTISQFNNSKYYYELCDLFVSSLDAVDDNLVIYTYS